MVCRCGCNKLVARLDIATLELDADKVTCAPERTSSLRRVHTWIVDRTGCAGCGQISQSDTEQERHVRCYQTTELITASSVRPKCWGKTRKEGFASYEDGRSGICRKRVALGWAC